MTPSEDEDRELMRLKVLADRAREVLQNLDDALVKAAAAQTVHVAWAQLKGPATTFARATLALVDLA